MDAENLALSGAEAEALVGDVERPVRADCHAGREGQARDDRLGRTVPVDAHDRSGAGGWGAGGGAHLERVQLPAAEAQAEALPPPGRGALERAVVRHPPHVLVT